jgi:copper chaperone CopZ
VFFHCANGKALLEKELSKKEGVYSVNADLETKVVKITYDSTKLNEQRLIEYIHQIGYLTENLLQAPNYTKHVHTSRARVSIKIRCF